MSPAAARGAQVLVVGAGLAGLAAALSLPAGTGVTVLSKRALGESNTRHAQGGIAAAVRPEDSAEAHARDTLAAGAGLAEPLPVRVLTAAAPEAIATLESWGVVFDRDAREPRGLAVGREGAHSLPRIVHAGGDATGAEIIRALTAALRARAAEDPGTRILEHTAATAILLADDAGPTGRGLPSAAGPRRAVGVQTVQADGTRGVIEADAIVLATGGAGQLYAHTTNPLGATGDGIALALAAGAAVADLEFVQFHPTTLAGADGFLISEAVRGEGAVLRDEEGHRFMLGVHPLAELAPRDVVAREIWRVMDRQGGRPVLLDATALGAAELAARFPTIDAATRAAGFDWARAPVPVTPAEHYLMGGVVTDTEGRSSVPGLWAVGEVARTGVHGANRLASNSLLEAVVFGRRAAAALLRGEPWPAIGGADSGSAVPVAGPPAAAAAAAGSTVPLSRARLQRIMWDEVGLVRDEERLARALGVLERAAPAPRPQSDAIEAAEDAGMIRVAREIARAALARGQSVGAHFRIDDEHVPAMAHKTQEVAA